MDTETFEKLTLLHTLWGVKHPRRSPNDLQDLPGPRVCHSVRLKAEAEERAEERIQTHTEKRNPEEKKKDTMLKKLQSPTEPSWTLLRLISWPRFANTDVRAFASLGHPYDSKGRRGTTRWCAELWRGWVILFYYFCFNIILNTICFFSLSLFLFFSLSFICQVFLSIRVHSITNRLFLNFSFTTPQPLSVLLHPCHPSMPLPSPLLASITLSAPHVEPSYNYYILVLPERPRPWLRGTVLGYIESLVLILPQILHKIYQYEFSSPSIQYVH